MKQLSPGLGRTFLITSATTTTTALRACLGHVASSQAARGERATAKDVREMKGRVPDR